MFQAKFSGQHGRHCRLSIISVRFYLTYLAIQVLPRPPMSRPPVYHPEPTVLGFLQQCTQDGRPFNEYLCDAECQLAFRLLPKVTHRRDIKVRGTTSPPRKRRDSLQRCRYDTTLPPWGNDQHRSCIYL